MIQLSPYHPEIDAIWHAVSNTGARSLAVVCAEPGEGTTMIAAALARRAGMATAQIGSTQIGSGRSNQAALLVDLNLARPCVAKVLGLRPQADEIVRLDAMGIAVVGAVGQAAMHRWRERGQLADQLRGWRSDWTVVVMDTAPLFTGDTDDIPGLTAAGAADACVLVTLAGRTPGNRIREARDKLVAAGANLIGTILNDRDNPSLLAELTRETDRFAGLFPKSMAALRARMHRSPVLGARV